MSEENTKFAIVMGGGDWTDASVACLVVPKDIDVAKAQSAWRDWYANEYCPIHANGPSYLSFEVWLIKNCGCRLATEDEIMTIDEP